jgi:hypothetical protein
MSLKKHNNPLGQRQVSETVGGGIEKLQHGQSAELVEKVRAKADHLQGKSKGKKAPAGAAYDRSGPDRQPGRVVKQAGLGSLQPQQGQYTQDNEEEAPD